MMPNTQKTLSFGYAYTRSTQADLNRLSQGSHEVVLNLLSQTSIWVVPENDRFERNERKIGSKNLEKHK